MIKYILYVFIVCFLGCSSDNRSISNAITTIDYSYSDGWNQYYSLKIDSMGLMVVMKEDNYNKREYGFYQLSKYNLESINSLVGEIFFADTDTLYKASCADCSSYYFIIKKAGLIKKVFVEDADSRHPETEQLSSLSRFLNLMIRDSVQFINDSFFESKTVSFRMIPPIRSRK